jgi:hypothetical protein
MDAALIAVAMHGLERIVAVLLGGLAVFYGYKLFLTLPTKTESNGEIRLPGMSVMLAKAGPGLFFVAFGALVIITSLFRPVAIKNGDIDYSGVAEKPPAAKPRPEPKGKRAGTEQEIVRTQLAVQSLNCMARLASVHAKTLGGDFQQSARESKLALLGLVWQADEWGSYSDFEQWATGRAAATKSAAKPLFEGERSDCPR